MVHLIILADDLTGAADAGGPFAREGWPTRIVFGEESGGDAAVLARSTESRDLPVDEAAAVNRRMAGAFPPATLVYKKIDSMVRGHPGAELRAVMAGLGETRALVAPALPVQGRTTVHGFQVIAGAPEPIDLVATLEQGQDLPVARLDLADVRQGVDRVVEAIAGLPAGLLVADAQTDRDLAAIAQGVQASGIRVVAGSAGLARRLAIALDGRPGSGSPPRRAACPAPLVVAASRHPATVGQVAALGAMGVAVVRPSRAILDGDDTDLEPIACELARLLADGRPGVLTTCGCGSSRRGPSYVVGLLASVVASLANRNLVEGLVLTGGDVAAGVADRLGATAIALGGEVRPAIPWGMLHAAHLPAVPVVTKAGGFGTQDALLDCLRFLQKPGPG